MQGCSPKISVVFKAVRRRRLSHRKVCTIMASYEHFDLLLGEALECLNEAAGEIKALSPSFGKNALKRIGRSICELWEARDDLYKIWPDLRRDFVKEYSEDQLRYENLSKILNAATNAEMEGDTYSATKHFKELLQVSCFGFFKLLAEAGLYRLSCKNEKMET